MVGPSEARPIGAKRRSAGNRGRPRPRGLALALCLAWLLGGCASTLPAGIFGGAEDVEIRPDADASYDVLVAHQHESEGDGGAALAAYERAVAKDPESAYLHRKVAEGLSRENRLDEALEHATRAHESEPEEIPTRLFLGQLHRMRRDLPAAERVLTNAAGDPIDERAGLLLFQVMLESERPEHALSIAQWMLAQDPESLRASLALATAYQKLGRNLEAEAVYRETLESNPSNLRISTALARSYRARKAYEEEIALYEQLLELHPRHHLTLIALAEVQMSRDDLAAAIETFEKIERYYPDDLRSVVRLGFLKFEAREWDSAAERFRKFLAMHPNEYDVVYFLGRVRRRGGDEGGAIVEFESIPREHKNYADARTELASIYERRGDYPRALEEVARARDAGPSRALELYSAQLQAKAGDFDGAVAHLEGLLSKQPTDDELLYNLGVVYGEAKRRDESIRYMQLALRENPDNASALNYVGYTWAEKGEHLDEAQEMIERALELRPNDGYITDSLGWVYYMRALSLVENGSDESARPLIEKALRELERAKELTGGDPVVSEHLGDIYLLKGERERAVEMFEEAVGLDPRLSEQPNLYEKLETLRRELH